MSNLCPSFCPDCPDDESSSGDEVEDDDADALSYVGEAAYDILRKKHNRYWHQLWNVTSGIVVGEAHQTPFDYWSQTQDLPDGHDDWFPAKMCEIMSRTTMWLDVMSLGIPDGLFMTKFKEGLKNIERTAKSDPKYEENPIIIRMMFGNIIGMPVNCDKVIKELTEDLDEDGNIELWVGAWRKGTSWNHAKIIAVDGHYLHTGGHNLWDQHYLKTDPVHDLSMEAEGRVAHDGHLFANEQWHFVKRHQQGCVGCIVSKLPDNLPTILQTRVTVSEWPEGKAETFPPIYDKSKGRREPKIPGHVPIISVGRYGAILYRNRPSDDAIEAMLKSARSCIRCALQDLGPITLPGLPGPVAVPGCVWPDKYLSAMGKVIWEDGVDVHIALSNPGSIPGGLSPLDALYGNGWTCNDVASELVKRIQKQFSDADDDAVRKKVDDNLHLCYIRELKGKEWDDGKTMGMHAKHFIIDDRTYYVGSQNLYIADLAEWGLVIDDEQQTKKMMSEYWWPMWKHSFTGQDCDTDAVMDGLGIDRNGGSTYFLDAETKEKMEMAKRTHFKANPDSEYFAMDSGSESE